MAEEGRWVTIKGRHVLLNADGEIADKKIRDQIRYKGDWTSIEKSFDAKRNMWVVKRRDSAGKEVGFDETAASELEADRLIHKHEREKERGTKAITRAARQAAGLENYDSDYIADKLPSADDIHENKDGTFTIRRVFDYEIEGKQDTASWTSKVEKALPMATIVDSGKVTQSSKGGLPKNKSHWWTKVKFSGK